MLVRNPGVWRSKLMHVMELGLEVGPLQDFRVLEIECQRASQLAICTRRHHLTATTFKLQNTLPFTVIAYYKYHTTKCPQDGLPTAQCPNCARQWQWDDSSWFRWARCAEMLFSIICWAAKTRTDNGRSFRRRCFHRTASATI